MPSPRLPAAQKSRPPPPAKPSAAPQQAPIPREAFLKRRSFLYSGAVAIIVIVGVISGAIWKTDDQAKEKVQRLQQQESDRMSSGQEVVSGSTVFNKGGNEDTRPTPPRQVIAAATPPLGGISKQIALLEERRGRLVGQKMGLEKKLEGVRAKIRLERERNPNRSSESFKVER